MKKTFLALLLATAALTTTSSFADTPAQIAADYRKQAALAVERLNQSLEKATTPLIAKLVSSGDTAGAEQLTAQLKSKLAGEDVATPHASAAQLFTMYDEARARTLAPVQKASISRIESMLKAPGGPKLESVAELGKVREEIEAGKSMQVGSDGSMTKGYLKKNKIAKVWSYYLTSKYDKAQGTFHLNDDGTLSIEIPSPGTGTWLPTSDPTILDLDIKNAAGIPEKTQMIIKGKEATIKRVSGMRYLKAN